MNKSPLGTVTTQGIGGEVTGAAGLVEGDGAETPPSKKTQNVTYRDTHSLLSHPAAEVALGDKPVKGNNPSKGKGGGGGEGSEGLDTRTGGGREEDLDFIGVTSTPVSHIQHS